VKKLHKLIISTYLGPFVLTFFITLFILVMQFLWKYIDEMVGKGLESFIIAELLFYASANLVPLALPLAILISSIMTFGNLGEHYELVSLKSAGMSLQKIMYPLIVVTILTSASAFYFSNNIWPIANLKFATLLYDIRQTKPAFDIKENVFYKGIDGYVIRVGDKDKDNQTIYDILIYYHPKHEGNNKVITAEKGIMQMSEDERYLVLTLYNGNSYEEVLAEKGKSNNYPLFRSEFDEEIIRFNLSGFQIERTNDDLFKDNYQMLNMFQLQAAIDTLQLEFIERKNSFITQLDQRLLINRDSTKIPSTIPDSLIGIPLLDWINPADKAELIDNAVSITRTSKTYVSALKNQIESNERSVWSHLIEWHRKLTLSFACIVLFFIGAPLGAIIRKGGLGMPVVVSVIFFLIFHVLSITGEKLVKQGELLPWQGMWMATAFLFPIGVFLFYKATTDSMILDIDTYKKPFLFIDNMFRRKNKS